MHCINGSLNSIFLNFCIFMLLSTNNYIINISEMDRDIADIMDIVNLANPPRVRNRRRRRRRQDPFRLPGREFKQRYRFSKEGVRRLAGVLLPYFGGLPVNQRGRPFAAELIVRSSLDLLGGGHFQRVAGVCANSCTTSAHKNLYR